MQKNNKGTVVTSVRFPADLYQAVKLQADELEIGISTIIKLALKEYLQKRNK